MEKLDSIFLRKIQQFSDWCQLWFGITNFALGYVCILLYCCTGVVVYLYKEEPYFSAGIIVWSVGIFSKIYTEEQTYLSSKFSVINTMSHTFIVARPILIMFTVYYDIDVLTTKSTTSIFLQIQEILVWIFYTLSFYFGSCTPKPPSKNKLKELWEKIVVKLSPLLA